MMRAVFVQLSIRLEVFMRPRVVLTAAAAVLTAGIVVQLGAQAPAPGGGRGAAPAGPAGQTPAGGRGDGRATFPAQQRPPGDPVLITRGKAIYEISCRACHGADLRGGDIGGPNLLRSEVVLKDDIGETRNLATTHPEKARELHDKLIAWREFVNAPMPTKNENILPVESKKGKKARKNANAD